jgi:hypothetical protein
LGKPFLLSEKTFLLSEKTFLLSEFFPAKIFFVQKDFPFPKYQKKFWREKN